MIQTASQQVASARNDSVELALLDLLQLEENVRAVNTLDELQFLCLNDTRLLLEYRQSLLWRSDTRRLVGASGLVDIDANSPFCTWVNALCRGVAELDKAERIHRIDPQTMESDDAERYAEYFPSHLIWLPIKNSDGKLIAALLLAKDEEVSLREKRLLSFLLGSYGHAWQGFIRQRRFSVKGKKTARWWLAAAVLMALIMLIPVRQSVVAPADIVPSLPHIVRAPMNGVVDKILVKPNQLVVAQQEIVHLDARELQQRLASARQAYDISQAELRMARQQSFVDERRKATLAVLEGKQAQAKLDLVYLQKQLERTVLRAPHDGVAIFDSQGDWLGKPLSLGEAIMTIADPKDTALEISLPLQDAIDLAIGSSVRLFLNSDPSNPIDAVLESMAYKATPTQDGQYALRLKAQFVQQDGRIRLGKKGLAKLYGEDTNVFYYLFRKPLSELRIWLTW
ncbi:efflux RND transporter periplasmic adaptor subunit [Marinomonas transparens]|uniref:HlyD family efflux transporter periplasmic adaptor subunit n=1 Tax=Marinomonas transparens TaxID=2795388 RepID=A0A934MZY0_9GAMM|nr:HlyD family efflux transporter periplasmic adaptor subunit [Marinomonas transparens]MBJ7536152.1 HlyD family efflux transporter periplasmic adaptor subunit [Marinomonas transparens]